MLVIRMQRTGRKGHAQFRVVVQDSRRTPTSGRVVASLGSFNPHTKQATIKKDAAEKYLTNGAQPSERVVRLFQSEGIKLPKWVKLPSLDKERKLRNPEKLRKNQPKEEAAEPAEVEVQADQAENAAETPAEETAEDVEQSAPEETPAEEPAKE